MYRRHGSLITSDITFSWEDVDGINPSGLDGELDFVVEYTLLPGCPARIHYDENDHPEEPPELEIYNILCCAIDNKPTTDEQEKLIGEWFMKFIHEKDNRDDYCMLYEKICDEVTEREYDYDEP